MNPHQKKFVSQTEAVFSFLHDRGIQIPDEQGLSEKKIEKWHLRRRPITFRICMLGVLAK